MEEVLEYLKKNPTYYLATVDAAGNPQIRPFGTIAKINDALYIQTGKSKACFKEMEAHPRIAISVTGADETSWLRLEADTTPDESVETVQAMLDQYPELQKMYAAGDGNTVLLKLSNVHATITSFTAEPKVFEF